MCISICNVDNRLEDFFLSTVGNVNHVLVIFSTDQESKYVVCSWQGFSSRRGSLCKDAMVCLVLHTTSSTHFQLLPAGSTMAPPQAAPDPISEAGGTYGKTYFRKGKTLSKDE